MVGKLVLRGFIIGIVAGLLAFGWAKLFGEPAVDTAINFESAQDDARTAAAVAAGKPAPPDDPMIFSRTVQSGIGLLTGLVVVGPAWAACLPCCSRSLTVASENLNRSDLGAHRLLGLVSVYIVPMLKYPANPPSVGEPDTIKYRTGLYFLMMAISIATTLGALRLRRSLVAQQGAWNASLLALGGYLVVIAAAFVLLPGINEVPATFPAVTLWNFRLASLGIQSVLWGSIAVMFGYAGTQQLRR